MILFEITARRDRMARTFTIQASDIDSAAMDAIKLVAHDETVVQVRQHDYDEADHVFENAQHSVAVVDMSERRAPSVGDSADSVA